MAPHLDMFPMNTSIMTWNCQGVASRQFLRVLKSLLQEYKPSVLALLEPRVSGRTADSIIKQTGYPNSHRIEATGFAGGIWLLWQDHMTLSVITNHPQFIHA